MCKNGKDLHKYSCRKCNLADCKDDAQTVNNFLLMEYLLYARKKE
jgi:hypothetical protein